MPGHQRIVDRIAVRSPHLPHGMVAIRMAARAAEEVPVNGAAHVRGDRMSQFFGVERIRMVFVNRFTIQNWLDRSPFIIRQCLIVTPREFGDVPVLPHVEIEPGCVMEVLR